MVIPHKTLSSGFSLPVYGAGTWRMGGDVRRDPLNDDARDVAALQQAIARGVTHFDTAELYAGGHAERLLGQAMKGHPRAALTIVSKASPGHHSAKLLRESLEASLERLQTDYLDVYMLHRFDDTVPIEETMGALDDLIDEGLVRHPAVSNFTAERFDVAQAASRHKIVANQLHYNVKVREIEHRGVLAHHQANDVFVIAWRPVRMDDSLAGDPVIAELCRKYECSVAQLCVNWLCSQTNVVVVAKTSSVTHLEDNLEALKWTMDDGDIQRLRNEVTGRLTRSDAVPLDY